MIEIARSIWISTLSINIIKFKRIAMACDWDEVSPSFGFSKIRRYQLDRVTENGRSSGQSEEKFKFKWDSNKILLQGVKSAKT